MKSGIYCIRHVKTGKCYVGQSVDIAKRFREHRGSIKSNDYVVRAINKYGVSAFAFEILELCDKSMLDYREMFWIATLGTKIPNGYNLTDGGGGTGRTLTPDERQKISERMRGTNNPMYGLTGEKNPFFGKKHTPETRQKMSAIQKQIAAQPNMRQKRSELQKGKTPSTEARAKMSRAQKGRKHTIETRRKISEALKGKPKSPEHKKKNSEGKKRQAEAPRNPKENEQIKNG